MKPIIKVEDISKQYRIGAQAAAYQTLRDSLTGLIRSPLRRLRSSFQGHGEMIWALKDISFEVEPGEVVGFIGPNGAGKSTLLKILSRITEPTTGRIDLYGRVGSLLEVGTGFHPELTGRENIYLNGAILGMRRSEIASKFDEIVAFSEIEKFIDTPVKHYSSGMYTRLAFAVAAHLEPEVLIVDEVLAVGDASFQKKCLGKMDEVAKAGRTVLFVSHNMTAIQSLCSRLIWLHKGQMVEDGTPGKIISSYLKTSFSNLTERVWEKREEAPGEETVRLRSARVYPLGGTPADPITVRTPFIVEFEFWNMTPGAALNLSFSLFNEEGVAVFSTGPINEPVWHGRPFPAGLFRTACHIPGDLLNEGTHRIVLYAVRDRTTHLFHYDGILTFEVREAVELREGWYDKYLGAVRPVLEWQTELIEARPDGLR